jgi:hypothetical protein
MARTPLPIAIVHTIVPKVNERVRLRVRQGEERFAHDWRYASIGAVGDARLDIVVGTERNAAGTSPSLGTRPSASPRLRNSQTTPSPRSDLGGPGRFCSDESPKGAASGGSCP